MPILALGADEVVVAWDDRILLFGLDGRFHATFPGHDPDSALVLGDGRLLLFDDGVAWVVRDGVIERRIEVRARATTPQILANGLVFDGLGDQATWIDPDTGEVASLKTEASVGGDPAGRRIDAAGLAAPGAPFVRPSEATVDMGECRFVPGDDRAWCTSRREDTCEVLGFTFDGTLAGRLPGCEIRAVGERSLVVDDGDHDLWIGLDDGVRASFPGRGDVYAVGGSAVVRSAGLQVGVWFAGELHPLTIPDETPLPPGIAVSGRGLTAIVDEQGKVVLQALGDVLPSERSGTRVHARTRDNALVVTDTGSHELFRIAEAGVAACTSGGDLLIVRSTDGSFAAWDVDTKKQRWKTRALAPGATCQLVNGGVIVSSKEHAWALDARTGRVITEGGHLSASRDGEVYIQAAPDGTVFVGRDGRVLGTLPLSAEPVGVADGVAIGSIRGRRSGGLVVAGFDEEGVRWERLASTAPVMRDGRVYLLSGGDLYAVDPADGHTVWSSNAVPGATRLGVVLRSPR